RALHRRARIRRDRTRSRLLAGGRAQAREPCPQHSSSAGEQQQMSDFRDRFGVQLTATSAALVAAGAADFRVRFGIQLTNAAADLAAARRPLAAPARREWALRIPRLGFPPANRPLARVLGRSDFRARFGIQLTRAAGDLATARRGLGGAPERRPWGLRVARELIPRLR